MKTQAVFLTGKGNPEKVFSIQDTVLPELKSDEVIIEVEAFGINYADVMARNGLYRETPPLPCVIGYEVVGKIIKVDSEKHENRIGKRVLAFTRFGGYSKHVVSNIAAITEVKDQPAEELMACGTQSVTAFYMSNIALNIRKNDNVLVHAAAGGVGTLLIQLCKLKGANVIAKVGSDAKIELVKELGADFVVNYNKGDYQEEIKNWLGGNKLDISFNPVAGSTFKKDLNLLQAGGRLVLFGGSELSKGKWGIFSKLNFIKKMGLMPPIGWMMLSKSIIGVNMLKIGDAHPETLQDCLAESVKLYDNQQLKVQVGGKYSIGELNQAHLDIESGKTVGKLSVFWE